MIYVTRIEQFRIDAASEYDGHDTRPLVALMNITALDITDPDERMTFKFKAGKS